MTLTHQTPATAAPPVGFATELRAATSGDHSSAEGGEFLGALFTDSFTRLDYLHLACAHRAIYRTLESISDALAGDPVVAPFLDRNLYRRDRLDTDVDRLTELLDRPAVDPGPAVREYCDRIAASAGSPARFVAHHYTRYLGDLSGGLMIHRRLIRNLPELVGADTFYQFGDLGNLPEFKDNYRTHLDAAPFDADEKRAVIDEVREAYRHNVNVFIELHRRRSDRAMDHS